MLRLDMHAVGKLKKAPTDLRAQGTARSDVRDNDIVMADSSADR